MAIDQDMREANVDPALSGAAGGDGVDRDDLYS